MDEFKEHLKPEQAHKDLNLLQMIESRIVEIVQIEEEVKKKCPKLFSQRLPRFMRRRAASHNPKRIPKRFRPTNPKDFSSKNRRSLINFRRRLRFQKHKRILKKHARHKYKDPDKTVLHKWFAKRFKMDRLEHIPLYNNTKNQRNLYRQTRYGCAYLSMAHLNAIKIDLPKGDVSKYLELLNKMTNAVSGFTFMARSLENDHYEVVIHLYRLPESGAETWPREYLCPAMVTKFESHFTVWVPRKNCQEVFAQFGTILSGHSGVNCRKIRPRDKMRVRLVGQESRRETLKIAEDKELHGRCIEDVDQRLLPCMSFGITIGRHIEEKHANFTYYQTNPLAVDVIFKGKQGRMLWYQLVRNKAHLVGGLRDVDRLLTSECFKLVPDCDRASVSKKQK